MSTSLRLSRIGFSPAVVAYLPSVGVVIIHRLSLEAAACCIEIVKIFIAANLMVCETGYLPINTFRRFGRLCVNRMGLDIRMLNTSGQFEL